MWFAYLVGAIVYGVIWGWACNKVIENKGYNENWFWWGFWFGFIAFIVALTKPDINYNTYNEVDRYGNVNPYGDSKLSQMAKERTEAEIMRNGGWKCSNCGRTNTGLVGTCACGWTKYQSENKVEETTQIEETKKEKQNSRNVESENLDILKKYKELLDMGAISQEEFDKKKNEILSAGNSVVQSDIEKKEEVEEEKEDPTSWTCSNCDKKNTLDRKSCKYCGAIKIEGKKYRPPVKKYDPNLADWKCPKCNTVNKCYMGMCKCGTSKRDGMLIEE